MKHKMRNVNLRCLKAIIQLLLLNCDGINLMSKIYVAYLFLALSEIWDNKYNTFNTGWSGNDLFLLDKWTFPLKSFSQDIYLDIETD